MLNWVLIDGITKGNKNSQSDCGIKSKLFEHVSVRACLGVKG